MKKRSKKVRLVLVQALLPVELDRWVRKVAKAAKSSKSALVRQFLQNAMDALQEETMTRRNRPANRWGCKPTEDVCVEHDLPLQCRHGCVEVAPHLCDQCADSGGASMSARMFWSMLHDAGIDEDPHD